MDRKSWSLNISEKQMAAFLAEALGCDIERIAKYYDEAYGDFVFRVTIPYGLDYLPKDDLGDVRLGKFGFVKDATHTILPTLEDDFGSFNDNPHFIKQYLVFMASKNKGITINGRSYEKDFEGQFSWFIMTDRARKLKEIEREMQDRKEFLKELKEGAFDDGVDKDWE